MTVQIHNNACPAGQANAIIWMKCILVKNINIIRQSVVQLSLLWIYLKDKNTLVFVDQLIKWAVFEHLG